MIRAACVLHAVQAPGAFGAGAGSAFHGAGRPGPVELVQLDGGCIYLFADYILALNDLLAIYIIYIMYYADSKIYAI